MQGRPSINSAAVLLTLLTLLPGSPVSAQIPADEPLHILYTTNLNAALDDCRCEGRLVGGMTRVLPLIEQVRDSLPDVMLVDSGDFLSSYSFPGVNKAMLKLMHRAEYDVLALGDQEFVEKADFLNRWKRQGSKRLPYTAANISVDGSAEEEVFSPYRIVRKGRLIVAVIALVSPTSFEFVSPDGLTISNPRDRLHKLRFLQDETHVQILLYHGNSEDIPALLREHRWLEAVVTGNNQRRDFHLIEGTAVVEAGVDGEQVGLLSIMPTGNSRAITNTFFDITADRPVDKVAVRISAPFYGSGNY